MTETAAGATDRAVAPLAVLARIRQTRPATPRRAGEHCELCSEPIGDEHSHLVDVERRALLCTCRGCALLFGAEGAGGLRFRAVPDRYVAFPDFRLSAAQWDALQIPVSVAFFFMNSVLGRVAALYPSPAGATESLLPLDAWDQITEANPELETLAPDVEAFLVRSERGAAPSCYLVPIDACYELVGRLRTTWRGFDGGADAHREIEAFFDGVRRRAGVR